MTEAVLVITPTIGSPELIKAYNSVLLQTYPEVCHLIVTDGPEYHNKVEEVLQTVEGIEKDGRLYRCTLPFNTGKEGYYGHRIFAGFAHLTDFKYICLLDEDNWYDPNHVESLVSVIEEGNFDWAYSLRKIYDQDYNFVCNDNCASLGKWSIYNNGHDYLIDTSCYCYTNKFFRIYGTIWDYGWGADGRFCASVQSTFKHKNFECSGLYTLNYLLHPNSNSDFDFIKYFKNGNAAMEQVYGKDNLPWQKR